MIPEEYRVYKLKVGLALMRFNDPNSTEANMVSILYKGSQVWCDQILEDGTAVLHACFGGEHAKKYPLLVDLYCQVPKGRYDIELEETDDFVSHSDRDRELAKDN